MKTRSSFAVIVPTLLVFSLFNSSLLTARAQGTAFSYQGQLQNSGGPAHGTYNLQFSLFTVATGRFISDYDEAHARAVVVIGNAIAESLFPHADPIGKQVRLNGLISKERVIELRSVITQEVFLHEALAKYIRRLVGATRPYNAETEWHYRSPSEMVEKCVDLGASPRATICWGHLVKVWALLKGQRSEVYPEDVQDLAKYILSHRVWLGPHAASHGVTTEMVIQDIVDRVPVP